MSDLEKLTCIHCVRRVEPMSDEAEGWVFVQRSIDEGDDHDDGQWVCPACASASDEYVGDPERQVRDLLADELPGEP